VGSITNLVSLLLVLGAAGPGCGSADARPARAPHPGNAEGDPSLTALPDADVDDAQLSARLREGMELAEDAMSLPMPTAPANATAAEMQEWTSAHLEPWIGQKTHAIDEAVEVLVAAAYEGKREQIVAEATIALLYEDLARELRAIPTPSDIETDPEIAQVYREVVEHYARPYAGRAHLAYRNCVRDTRQGPRGMRHWAAFCDARRDNLPYEPMRGSAER
jgi:hypothetical protein